MANNDKMSKNKKIQSNNKKPKRRKDIKQQRWASVVAAVLAFGMVLSVAIVGLDYILGRDRSPAQEMTAEDYLEFYTENVENLEAFIEEFGPTTAVLEQLAESYSGLIMIRQIFFDDAEKVKENERGLAQVYQSLIELEPEDPRYYLELLNIYHTIDNSDERILELASTLSELLRQEPNPTHTLSLLHFYLQAELDELIEEEASILSELLRREPDPNHTISLLWIYKQSELDELLQDEAAWLKDYLEDKLSAEEVDNHDRFLYGVLLGEYLGDEEAALAQIELILEEEEEDSELYKSSADYRDQLLDNDDDADGEE